MTYAEEAAHKAIDGARRCEFAAGGVHSEACRAAAKAIDAAIKATAEAIGPCGHPSCDRFGDYDGCLRVAALAAPPAGVGATFEDGPQCQSCEHHEAQHTPECENCGCWGFFRKGANHCDNPRCEGTGCAGNRGTDHGPNDTSAPAGTGGRR